MPLAAIEQHMEGIVQAELRRRIETIVRTVSEQMTAHGAGGERLEQSRQRRQRSSSESSVEVLPDPDGDG